MAATNRADGNEEDPECKAAQEGDPVFYSVDVAAVATAARGLCGGVTCNEWGMNFEYSFMGRY